jgi:hypothetical protein
MSEINKEQLIDEKYNDLSVEEKQHLYKMYFDEKTRDELKRQVESIIYYSTPPTPEEFLDPANGWLSESFVQSIYPWVKAEFLECLDKEKNTTK